MCLALPDAGNKHPRRWWQRLGEALRFVWMLLGMLGSGLLQHWRRGA